MRMASPMSVATNKAFDIVQRDNKINMRELEASNVMEAFPSAFNSEEGSNEGTMRRTPSKRLRKLFESKFFEIFMVTVLLANVLWMAMHLQVYGQAAFTEQEVPATWSLVFKRPGRQLLTCHFHAFFMVSRAFPIETS